MRDFKQTLKKVGGAALFLAILALLLGVLSRGVTDLVTKNDDLVPARNKSTVKIRQEAGQTIDVLIVGDSLSYSSFSPMQLWNSHGMAAFVGGQSGQTIQESYYMMKTAFQKQSPKVVVLETNVIFRAKEGLDGIGESIRTCAGYYFPVFTYHDVWKSLVTGKRWTAEDYKGFQFRNTVTPYMGGSYMTVSRESRKISPVVKVYLEKIIKLCEKKDAKLILVSIPSPSNYSLATHKALQAYAKNQGIPYTDLNLFLKELKIDWQKDGLDGGDHLNLSGAGKVTSWLGNYLKETFSLPDHRGEERYAAWENMAKKYEKRAKEILENM